MNNFRQLRSVWTRRLVWGANILAVLLIAFLGKYHLGRIRTSVVAPTWDELAAESVLLFGTRENLAIVIASDYLCRYCQLLGERVAQLNAEGRLGGIGVGLIEVSLTGNPAGGAAARVAVCVERYKGRLGSAHMQLFRRASAAAHAGVDSVNLDGLQGMNHGGTRDCLSGNEGPLLVRKHSLLGERLKVGATPTIITRDTVIVGAVEIPTLLNLIEAAEAEAEGDRG